MVIYWPNESNPSLKLTFGPFQRMPGFGSKSSLLSEVTVQNVSGTPIPKALFPIYMLDKDKVRIGNGVLVFDDLAPGESPRVEFQCETVRIPATLALMAHGNAEGIPNATKVVPLKIISAPAGDKLKVDGKDEGITPTLVNPTVGTHQVELSKEGVCIRNNPGRHQSHEMPGGSDD